MKRWTSYLIMVLLLLGVLIYYFHSEVAIPLHLDVMWKTKTKQNSVSMPEGREVSEEVLAFRQKHHLRPLTEMENGTRTRDAARGVYGYSTCDVQTLHATWTKSLSLEIHKHLDGIVYYVGYASEDHIEKYVTHQKNFHIVAFLEPRRKASLLFEIPVDFVSKCTMRSEEDGSQFDLFVMAIPELLSFREASVSP